jgi:hypothetical protein
MPSPIAEYPEAREYKIKHLYNFSVLVPWWLTLFALPTQAMELLCNTEYPEARGYTIKHLYNFSVLVPFSHGGGFFDWLFALPP